MDTEKINKMLCSMRLTASISLRCITLHDVTCRNSHFCCTLRASNPAAWNKEHSWARELLCSSFKYSRRLVWAMDRSVLLAHCNIRSGRPASQCQMWYTCPTHLSCTSVTQSVTCHLKKGHKTRETRRIRQQILRFLSTRQLDSSIQINQFTLKPPGINRYYSHIYTKSFLPFGFVYTYLPRVLRSCPSHRIAKIPRTGQ